MKRYLYAFATICIILNILFSAVSSVKAFSYSSFEGYGTEKNPFLLRTVKDLQMLAREVNEGEKYSGMYFLLANDIDMQGSAFAPIGSGTNSFDGFFDGNCKTVRNVTVSSIGKGIYLGFFGTISGTVRNLNIHNISITFENTSNSLRVEGVGGLAGRIKGKVCRCGVNGVSITNSRNDLSENAPGGFAGIATDGCVISDCYSVNFNWNGSQNAVLGGFIGSVNNSSGKCEVKNCYCAGDFVCVKTPYAVYSMGKVSKAANLIKSNNYVSHGVATNKGVLTQNDIAATVLTQSEMKNGASRMGAEFQNDSENDNDGYPCISQDALAEEKLKSVTASMKITDFAVVNENGDVVSNLTLPTNSLYGSSIIWESLTPEVIGNTGQICDCLEPAYAKIRAIFSLDGVSVQKDFEFKVAMTRVKADVNAVTLPETVSGDFVLPLSGSVYNSNFEWTAQGSSITISRGVAFVKRPSNSDGKETVSLTVTARNGNDVFSKNFYVTVLCEKSDADSIADAANLLTFDCLTDEENTAVTKNLYLPKAVGDGVNCTWSSVPDVISSDGTVTRSISGDTKAVLTAFLTKGNRTEKLNFNVTVKKASSVEEVLEKALDDLTFDKLSEENIDCITEDLTLPSAVNGIDISWTSDNEDIIKISKGTGKVTRPDFQNEVRPVKLTATLLYNQKSVQKDFYVTVLENDGKIYYLDESFNSFEKGNLPENEHFKVYGNTVDVSVCKNPTADDDKVLKIYKTPSMGDTDNSYTFRISKTASKGIIVFESDIYVNSMPEKSFRIAGKTNIGTEIKVEFIPAGNNVTVSCGGVKKTISKQKWHKIEIVMDTYNRNYSAYIDSDLINMQPVAFEYTDNDSERSFAFFICDFFWTHPTSAEHSVYMDNVSVYQPIGSGTKNLSSLLDRAELYFMKRQNLDEISTDLNLYQNDYISFESKDLTYISSDGRLINKDGSGVVEITASNQYGSSVTKQYFLGNAEDGTENNPYIIENINDLLEFSENVNGGNTYEGCYFKLANDIDLNGIDWIPVGIGTNSFAGCFDGNGHTVSNVTVTDTGEGKSLGFFGKVSGIVKNLGIKNVSLTFENSSDTATKVLYVGGLVGNVTSSGQIDRCFAKNVTITNTSNSVGLDCAGGLVGRFSGTAGLSNSYIIDFTFDSTEVNYVGAIAGRFQSSSTNVISVFGCYAAGNFVLVKNNESRFPFGSVGQIAYVRGNNNYISHNIRRSEGSTQWDAVEKSRSNLINSGCVTPDEMRSASLLGDAYEADVDMINGGYPMLLWEISNETKNKFICTGLIVEDNSVKGVKLEKVSSENVSGKMIAAVYSDEKLTEVLEIKSVEQLVKGANMLNFENGRIMKNNEDVRIYVWSDLVEMKPLMIMHKK